MKALIELTSRTNTFALFDVPAKFVSSELSLALFLCTCSIILTLDYALDESRVPVLVLPFTAEHLTWPVAT